MHSYTPQQILVGQTQRQAEGQKKTTTKFKKEKGYLSSLVIPIIAYLRIADWEAILCLFARF